MLFRSHPYGCPVIGFAADLDRMTTKDLKDFYRNYYAPNNATIVIVGDLTEADVVKHIAKNYKKLKAANTKRFQHAAEPKQIEERRKIVHANVQVEKCYIAYKVPSATHEDLIILDLIGTLLSSGRSSRLYKVLVDKGLVMGIGAGPSDAKYESLFYFSFSAQVNKEAEQAIKKIDIELKRIFAYGISTEELRRAKNKYKTEFYKSFVSNSSKAYFLGHSEIIYKDFAKVFEAVERAEKATKTKILNVMKKYFQPTNRSIVIMKPEQKGV